MVGMILLLITSKAARFMFSSLFKSCWIKLTFYKVITLPWFPDQHPFCLNSIHSILYSNLCGSGSFGLSDNCLTNIYISFATSLWPVFLCPLWSPHYEQFTFTLFYIICNVIIHVCCIVLLFTETKDQFAVFKIPVCCTAFQFWMFKTAMQRGTNILTVCTRACFWNLLYVSSCSNEYVWRSELGNNQSGEHIFKTLQVMQELGRPDLIVDSAQPEDTLIIHSLISLHTLIMIDKHLYVHLWSQHTDRIMHALLPHTCNAKGNRNLNLVNQ